MSFNVLVVPEDPANNGYILKPLISRMFAECGKTNAKVTVLTNPRAKGYEHAKGLLRNQLFERYRHMTWFIDTTMAFKAQAVAAGLAASSGSRIGDSSTRKRLEVPSG